ncbi:rho-related GTP-binding protein RhoD [Microcaecilia unicolor]|uniref:Rho-related GTP-binding protein RhoD n=1 Tax=Microcaecilia unicolor TaxID=1415580 RepID=A0A6P7WV01_9AMPH|nr:rho-related GTP-binding protein RhoD [Microcaecilia unicolor]
MQVGAENLSNGHAGERGLTSIKAVIVGDGSCGKTSLLMVFARGDFPEVYVPTVFERYTTTFQLGNKSVEMNLWDTAGQEDYDRLRPLSYTGANVIIICYDVTNPGSFDNVLTKWYPEVNHFCKGVPVLLVGCKTDLRKDKVRPRKLREDRLEPITYQKGQSMAREVRALMYLECSAKFQENIMDIFAEATAAALQGIKRKQRKSTKRSCVLS